MQFEEAIQTLQKVQDHLGLPLLETMEYMMDHPEEFSFENKVAFRTVYNGMAKLLAPAH